MAQKVLSIYITEEEIKICEAKKAGKRLQVSRVFSTETPKGSVEGGMIVDVEQVADAMRTIFAANAMKKERLIFTIASRKIAAKEITVPYVKNTQKISEMIHANINDFLPMGNIDDYVCRYAILDTVRTNEGGHYSISLAAARKELIASYYELAEELNMPLEALDYYGNSIYSIVRGQMAEGVTLALQMDEEVTYVSIMQGRTQLFRRSVPYGQNAMVQSLADLKKITPAEAAKLLDEGHVEGGIPAQEAAQKGTAEDDALEQHDTQTDYITWKECREMIGELVASSSRVVDYFIAKNQGVVVERAHVFGGYLNIPGMLAALSHELELDITPGIELKGVVIGRKNPYGVTMEGLSGYLPNLGALLEPMKFGMEEEKRQVDGTQVLQILVILAAFAVCVLAGLAFWQNYQLRETKAALDAENAKLQPAQQIYDEYEQLLKEYDVMQQYYGTTVSDTEALYQFLLKLEDVTPKSVGISDFSIDSGEITLTGVCDGKAPLADFIMELKKIPYVSNVRLAQSTDTNSGTHTEFEMSLHISQLAEEETQETQVQETETPEGGEENAGE